MPDKFGNWLASDLFAAGIPQLQPKPDGSENMLAQPGVGLPIGWGTAAGMAGGIMGTAVGNPLVQSVMNLPQTMSDLGHGIPLTANSAGTGIDPYIGKVVDVTGMLAGGGMPMAEAGAAGIFGGKLAKTANLEKLEQAKSLQAAGHVPDDILAATGWFQGADKQWRFEIPDEISHFKGTGSINDLIAKRGNEATDVFYHPELYKAYPDIAYTKVQSTAPYESSRGYFQAGYPLMDIPATIGLNYGKVPKNPTPELSHALGQDMRSTMLHELQHNVQDIEGFAGGGRVPDSRILTPDSPIWDFYQQKLSNPMPYDLFKQISPMGDYKDYLGRFENQAKELALVEHYKRLAGEVEARNVQKRMDYGPEKRRDLPPAYTQEYANSEQIFPPWLGGGEAWDTGALGGRIEATRLAPEVVGGTGRGVRLAEKYVPNAPPVMTTDPKTGNVYPKKALSEQGLEVQAMRQAAQKEIDAGNYTPFFDPAKRFDVDPANYPAYQPTSNLLAKKPETQAKWDAIANSPEAIANLDEAFKRGMQQKDAAGNWYHMGQLEDAFVREYGPDKGRQLFKERFAEAMAATTGGASPTQNLIMAHYGNYMKNKGMPVPTEANEIPFPIGGGKYGVKNNMKMFNDVIYGGSGLGPDNPKRYNFSNNFLGTRAGSTVDEQMMGLFPGGMSMPPPGTYGHFENAIANAAAKAGVDPRYFQEVAWAGTKDANTKGGFAASPMIDIVNQAIERTSRITGLTPEEVVRRGLVRSEIPLYSGGIPLPGAGVNNQQ